MIAILCVYILFCTSYNVDIKEQKGLFHFVMMP